MSCDCKNNTDIGAKFACPCDRFEHPRELNIGAGLTDLPRQIAGFPEFRRAMLYAIRDKAALSFWQARREDDLGVMLLEMWAYVCDALSFYDKVIAHEAYLRTAQLRPSLRKLIALLGYLPAPAVGATVTLAAIAEGRQPVTLPAGTAFRSGAFNGNPPQLFELDFDTVIHPFTNRWTLRPPLSNNIAGENIDSLLVIPQAEIKPDSNLLLINTKNADQIHVLNVTEANPYTSTDGRLYTKLNFEPSIILGTYSNIKSPKKSFSILLPIPLAQLRLLFPTQTALVGADVSPGSNVIILDNIYSQIKPGEYALISRKEESRWFRIEQVTLGNKNISNTIIVDKKTTTVEMPVTVTQLTLDVAINNVSRKGSGGSDWSDVKASELVVHYGMQPAGIISREPKTTLISNDPLLFVERPEKPTGNYNPHRFLLSDKNMQSTAAEGQIDFSIGGLKLDQGKHFQQELILPVEVFGNIIKASRGEQVSNEILGSGDASSANQTFKLKKKPLTYLHAPTAGNEHSIQSTLRIYVNGILWTQVASFYGKKPNDQVYIVRQNDDSESLVTFGDGIRGERLPTGRNNVIAFYRYGAGKASPPSGAVNQIAKPVKGLQSVTNTLAAFGGADAEPADRMRTYAPRSALLLGRAVSMKDIEAVAFASRLGIQAVQAEWRWHGTRQCPVAHVFYIGDAGIESLLSKSIRNVSDPSIPIQVEQAKAIPLTLAIDIDIDPRYFKDTVLAELRQILTNPQTGLLAAENIGIGRPLFRSQVFAAVLSVKGILAVRSISWNKTFFIEFAKTPHTGHYFDLDQGELQLNGNNR